MELTLTNEEGDALRALITAVELYGAWTRIEQGMAEAGINDPDSAFNALRDKAFS